MAFKQAYYIKNLNHFRQTHLPTIWLSIITEFNTIKQFPIPGITSNKPEVPIYPTIPRNKLVNALKTLQEATAKISTAVKIN